MEPYHISKAELGKTSTKNRLLQKTGVQLPTGKWGLMFAESLYHSSSIVTYDLLWCRDSRVRR